MINQLKGRKKESIKNKKKILEIMQHNLNCLLLLLGYKIKRVYCWHKLKIEKKLITKKSSTNKTWNERLEWQQKVGKRIK